MSDLENREVSELKSGINNLSVAVNNLNVNVATQTEAIKGFKDLYEHEVSNIHKELSDLNRLTTKVQEHELYIAKTETKIAMISNMIKAGWTVIGVNVIGFVVYLVKDYLVWKSSNG